MTIKNKTKITAALLFISFMGDNSTQGASNSGSVDLSASGVGGSTSLPPTSVAVQATPEMSVFNMGLENFRLAGRVETLEQQLRDEKQARAVLADQVQTQEQKISTLEQQERAHTAAGQQQALVNAAPEAQAKALEEDLQKKTMLIQALAGPLQLLSDEAKQKIRADVSSIVSVIDEVIPLNGEPSQRIPERVRGIVPLLKRSLPSIDTAQLVELSTTNTITVARAPWEPRAKLFKELRSKVQAEGDRLLSAYDVMRPIF